MALNRDSVLQWSPPYRAETAFPGVLVGANTTELLSAGGRWTNCDVYIDAPASWYNANPTLCPFFRLYGLQRGEYIFLGVTNPTLMVFSPSPDIDPSVSGRLSSLMFRVRGVPCDGFVLTGNPNTATLVDPAMFRMECSGEESNVDIIDQKFQPGLGMFSPLQMIPVRDSRMMGYDKAGKLWYGVAVDPATGQLIVQATVGPPSAGPLSSAPTEQTGTLVAATPTTLAAAAVVNRITIASDLASTVGSVMAVGYSATPVAVQLGPGDSVDLFVTNANKVTLLTASSGVIYHASIN